MKKAGTVCILLFCDGGPYHVETNSLVCWGIQWTGFYMIGASAMKKLIVPFRTNAPLYFNPCMHNVKKWSNIF